MLPEDKQAIHSALWRLINQYRALHQAKRGTLPKVEYDATWSSPAECGEPTGDEICWQVVEQPAANSFANVEDAIGIELPASGKDYWQSVYSGNIGVEAGGFSFELLLPWNSEDLQRYQENLIGHLLLQKKRRLAPTMFIGCGIDDERILSVSHDGRVIWEWPGQKQQHELAANLSAFLTSCELKLLP